MCKQVVQYYRTALSCATMTAAWEKDSAKCTDVIRLAHRLSAGEFLCNASKFSSALLMNCYACIVAAEVKLDCAVY